MSIFNNQYNLIYQDRFKRLKEDIIKNLNINQLKIFKNELTEVGKMNEICCIGLLFIKALKPSIFDEINKIEINKYETNYNEDIEYELEDNYGKIKIIFEKPPFIVTGQILGIEGRVEGGIIIVKNIIFPKEIINKYDNIFHNETVMFVSNIVAIPEFEYFIDSLKENKVEKLIIIGIKKYTNFFKIRTILHRIKDIQVFLISEISSTVKNSLPYESIDLNLTINSCSNPSIIQNYLFIPKIVLKDILKYHPSINYNYSDLCIDAIKLIIKSKHCCPTSPDTIKCDPFITDPFIINKDINCIIVAGDKFIYKNKENIHFISIPDFSKTQRAVYLTKNIFKTLKYELIVKK